MTKPYQFQFFVHGRSSYFCGLCAGTETMHPTYRSLRRHLFEGPEACLKRRFEPEYFEDPDPPFDGERVPVPSAPPAPESLADHRDANGRLRVAGTVEGYRAWSVGRVAGEFRLFPFFAKREGSAPYPRGVATACCDVEYWEGEPHRSPDASCSCGLYAFWTLDEGERYRASMRHASLLGRIEAWGKVLPGEKGFRSEFAMVSTLITPTCMAPRCTTVSTRFIARPRWTEWMTPGGRTYPRVNDRRYTTYRDTADFAASLGGTSYLGWYCDEHAKAELVPPDRDWFRCNFPSPKNKHRCARPSTFILTGVPYSWCHEHAPLVFDTAEVMAGLSRSYDVDFSAPGSLSVADYRQS